MITLTSFRTTYLHRGKVLWAAQTSRKDARYFCQGAFSPKIEHLTLLKNRTWTHAEFVRQYEIDLQIWRERAERLLRMAIRPDIDMTLVCVCSTGARARRECHLCVLAEWIRRVCPEVEVQLDSETVEQEEPPRWWVAY